MDSVELFSGAGGLALGTAQAGFRHLAVLERDGPSCETLLANKDRDPHVSSWPIHRCDIRDFDYSGLPDEIDLVAGGPPCQPFSLGGKHGGHRDQRDMFPEVCRAVRELRPRAFIVENVRGLLRESFARYFEYVKLRLEHPQLTAKPDETWLDHLDRLERQETSGREEDLHYHVVFRCLNAADYGVPQRRERVFIVGFRADLGIEWAFPEPTHSKEALLFRKWVTGEYWDQHKVPKKHRDSPPSRNRIDALRDNWIAQTMSPWPTVRDALASLPKPTKRGHPAIEDHVYIPGARVYPGHTGSPQDEPAKTLKAGVHGVPGGENMTVLDDGSVRYFTVRESARLQGYPDHIHFPGCWSETMRQLGNSVPVTLGQRVGAAVHDVLK